jgi:hypothetical protein
MQRNERHSLVFLAAIGFLFAVGGVLTANWHPVFEPPVQITYDVPFRPSAPLSPMQAAEDARERHRTVVESIR